VAAARILHLGKHVFFGDIGGDLEVGVDRDDRSQDQPQRGGGFARQDSSHLAVREGLGLHTRGFVYHPRFFVFQLRGHWTFEQGREEGTGENNNTNERLTDYRATGTFLRAHPYSLDLSASRTTNLIDAAFTPQEVQTSQEEEVRLRLKRYRFPTTVSYRRSSTELSGIFPYQERREEGHYDSRSFHKRGTARLSYDYDRQDSTSLANNLTSHRVQLTGDAALDPENERRVNGRVELFRQSGNVVIQRNLGVGTFHWAFADTVTSDLSIDSDKEVLQGRDIFRNTLRGQLRHRLYESLFTTLSGRLERQSIDEGQQDEGGGAVSVTYRKRIPGGVLSLTAHAGRIYTTEQDLGGTGQAVAEAHTIPVEGVVPLEHGGVVAESVIVTDSTGLLLFVRDVDYRVIDTGTGSLLATVVGGRLQPGREIRVTYAFLSQPDAAFVTLDRGAGVDLSFRWGVQLYLHQSTRHQGLVRGTVSDNRLQPERHTEAGAIVKHGPSSTSFQFVEQIDPNTPYRRLQARESLQFRPYRNLSLGLTGQWGVTRLPTLQDSFQGRSVVGQVRWQIRGRVSTHLEAGYDTQEQIGDRVDRLHAGVEVTARYRQYRLVVTDRQEHFESASIGQTDENILYVRLHRDF